MQILGILNVTRDSFSDGGRFLAADLAIAHARVLRAGGADLIDVGAEATHPEAEDVPAEDEVARLRPVICALRAHGMRVSVDTHKPAVMRAVLELGVEIINDVTGLRDLEAVAVLRDSPARIIVMHSTSAGARAQPLDIPPDAIVAQIVDFFRRRLDELERARIERERLILDPGMGFFLSRDPEVSLEVLRHLPQLAELGAPLCLSVSRKSFIGGALETVDNPRPVDRRWAGTLATELWAVRHGVEYVRTHDVRALRDAWRLWQALEQP